MKVFQMFTLLNEVHFWTLKNGTCIRDTDFGALKYYDKKGSSDSLLLAGKKSYVEKRGMLWSPSNKRPSKLKDSLKELEDQLDHHRILYLQWKDNISLQLVLNSGLVINITVNPLTGDAHEIVFDKYMSGKLLSDYISDVVITSTHAVFTYADNQVTLVYFVKPVVKTTRKWSSLDAKLQVAELSGPAGRRLGRKLSVNTNADMILVWWKCGRDEVYPWSPVVRDQDRANVHIYTVNGLKVDLLCYYRTEYDPVIVAFSQKQPNVVHSVQQKVSRKGEVSVDWSVVEVTMGRLSISALVSLPLPTHPSATALSPTDDKLLIACIDGSLLITDSTSTVTSIAKAAFIPSLVSWHPDSSLIVIANERGQLQFFDLSLTCVKAQLISEDVTPSSILDLGTYFKNQPSLLQVCWNKKAETAIETVTQPDSLLLLVFERGSIAVVRVVGGGGCGSLVGLCLGGGAVDRALSLLSTLSWDSQPDVVLSVLQNIVNYLLKLPLNPERESLLEKALGCYHAPKKPISQATQLEFGDPVHDLTRKFFHHLVRYQVFEKAFRLAIDLGDYDLFMDIHNYCKRIGNTEMAMAALEKAEQLSECSSSRSVSSSCSCSSSTCSCCSDSSSSSTSSRDRHKSAPPLPIIPQPAPRHKVKFASTVTHITVPTQEEQLICEDMNTVGLPGVDSGFHRSYPTSSNTAQILNNGPIEEEETSKIKVVHFGLV